MSATQELNLSLQPITSADLPLLFEFQNDPLANDMADFPARNKADFIAHWQQNILASDTAIAEGIWLKDDAGTLELVGSIVCWSMTAESADAPLQIEHYLGYWIGPANWGKGIATDAVSQFITRCHRRPLLANVVEHNIGSIKVLKNNGFVNINPEQFSLPIEANMQLFYLN
ncbi:GNAT family N-acetyltransferase [Shewanella goraebulensis]|uniref:GNAT family N-acetyltransferase n=1 Tax=Shewanella goraebulensis TaxID=3050637 RepID=UPI00254BE7C4|nr:GNAT family N-acetyltransferase [Shewanella goraebulensis]